MLGNPEVGTIFFLIASLGVALTSFFILYCLNKQKFKELMKWFFNCK